MKVMLPNGRVVFVSNQNSDYVADLSAYSDTPEELRQEDHSSLGTKSMQQINAEGALNENQFTPIAEKLPALTERGNKLASSSQRNRLITVKLEITPNG